MTRTQIVAGNWKMNTMPDEGVALAKHLASLWTGSRDKRMIVAAPFTHLFQVSEAVKGSQVTVAAQNCHWETKGAFTGEVSPTMLKALGINTVILGHSERREIFLETNEVVRRKVDAALAAGLEVILCCGESLDKREAGAAQDFVERQLKENLLHLKEDALASIIIAYEPIWAIGTGVTATSDQAQEMHAFIRGVLANAYSRKAADRITILYGGSVKGTNAAELFSQKDVDGGLVGGASLNAEEFMQIAAAL